MTTVNQVVSLSPAPVAGTVATRSTGMRRTLGSYRPKARASFVAPLPRAGRHVAAVAAPSLAAGLLGATVTATALMLGLAR